MFKSLRNNLIWSEGKYILYISGLTVLLSILSWSFLALPVGITVFGFYFFRNPDRSVKDQYITDNTENNVIICPADGKIVDIKRLSNNTQKVSIFLSPLNVHVNWIPVSGLIKSINYKPGTFKPAFVPKSSELNERNDIVIVDNLGREIVVRQIAGMLARRISCWLKTEQKVVAGQKYGIIHFSSRVDIILPSDVNVKVAIGQKVFGGQTILGLWSC